MTNAIRVIHVPAPTTIPPHPRWILAFLLVLAIFLLALALFGSSTNPGFWAYAVVMSAGLFCAAIFQIRRFNLNLQRHESATQARARRGAEADCAELTALWRRVDLPPTSGSIAKALEQSGRLDREGPVVVCLAPVMAPEPGDYRFEPTVITPAQAWRFEVRLAAWAGGIFLALFILAASKRGLTIPAGVASGFACMIALPMSLCVAWACIIRPAYVRFAPGRVQVLRYWLGRTRPSLRDYPMQAGTIAVVRAAALTLIRGKDKDRIALTALSRNDPDLVRRLICALVSTAETPPLSPDLLQG